MAKTDRKSRYDKSMRLIVSDLMSLQILRRRLAAVVLAEKDFPILDATRLNAIQ